MKILLIYRLDTEDLKNLGVIQKLKGQSKAFASYGMVSIITITGSKIIKDDIPVKKFKSYRLAALHFFKTIDRQNLTKGYDLVYIRYGLSSRSFIKMLSNIRGKIIVEIPTYPYGREFKGLVGNLRLIVDVYWRVKMIAHVSSIVHFGQDERIFGIPTINITNAVDLSVNEVSSTPFNKDKINMIAVGKWNRWHGLDRVIEGLANYYKDGKMSVFPVNLSILGEGPELPSIKNNVEKKSLGDVVKFYGLQRGDALDRIYLDADIGVGSLGLHRIGLKEASPLKNREYVARGLVVIYAGNDEILSSPYAIQLPSNNDLVDIEEIVKNYKRILEKNLVKDTVRTYNLSELGWESRIQKIIDNSHLDN